MAVIELEVISLSSGFAYANFILLRLFVSHLKVNTLDTIQLKKSYINAFQLKNSVLVIVNFKPINAKHQFIS